MGQRLERDRTDRQEVGYAGKSHGNARTEQNSWPAGNVVFALPVRRLAGAFVDGTHGRQFQSTTQERSALKRSALNMYRQFSFSICLVFMAVLLSDGDLAAQPPGGERNDVEVGLSINKPNASQGYGLIFPMNSTSTYLVDMEGRVVNEWKSEYTPALSAYLLPNGNLLRPGAERGPMSGGPGSGGRLQVFNWDGDLVWDFSITSLSRENLRPHHDICPLPNGNVLVIASEIKSAEVATAAGRRPESVRSQLQADCILEIKPTGKTSGEVVWEWHAWDHLIQDADESKPNYGDVSEHPERIDVNFGSDRFSRMLQDPAQLARLRSLGYVGGGDPRPGDGDRDSDDQADAASDRDARASNDQDRGPRRDGRDRRGRGGPGGDGDWMHTNSVAYNAELDQVMLSIHGFSEVWIIDHSTTTAEAASNSGGKRGKGGDLLYRWGNPQAYRTGSNVDQRLFHQHCAHWIPEGLPGAGNMLVFNNGADRPDGSYSSVDEVVLPLKKDGTYEREEYVAFGPEQAKWSYVAEDKSSFFSGFISGTQRLPNGNTLICSGGSARVFEVTPDKEIVWQYKHPGGGGPGGPGGFPGFAMPRPGEILPEFLQGMLRLSEEQRQSIAKLQQEVDQRLEEVLTKEQRDQLAEMGDSARRAGRGFGPPGFGGPPPRDVARDRDRGPDGDRGPDRGRRPERDRGPDRDGDRVGRRGRGGPGGGGPGGLFRAYRYALDYPAFQGKTLAPGEKLDVLASASRSPQNGDAGRPPRPNRPE